MALDEVIVRAARFDDAPMLAALLRAAFEEYRGRLDPPSGALAETEASIRSKLTAAAALIAEVDGMVAGCVFVERQPGRLYLSRLSVLPAHRRRGVGRALIAAVEALARALGLPCVRLDVRLALTQQRAYYDRLGYRQVGLGTHAGYPAPTFATLERPIEP
jgi:ribosomal protein S18 acetylase RimI-like enzyme